MIGFAQNSTKALFVNNSIKGRDVKLPSNPTVVKAHN